MHKTILKNGKVVNYHENYAPYGVAIYVKTKLLKEEKIELKSELTADRDLISVFYDCKCIKYCYG